MVALSCGTKPAEPAKIAASPAVDEPKAPQTVSVRLENLCPEPSRYRIGRVGAPRDPERVLAGGVSESITVELGEGVFNVGGSSAQLDSDGVIWFGADCKSIGAASTPGFDPRNAVLPSLDALPNDNSRRQ